MIFEQVMVVVEHVSRIYVRAYQALIDYYLFVY